MDIRAKHKEEPTLTITLTGHDAIGRVRAAHRGGQRRLVVADDHADTCSSCSRRSTSETSPRILFGFGGCVLVGLWVDSK